MSTTTAARRREAAQGRRAAKRLAGSRAGRLGARAGYLVRTGFYLLLAGLVARMAYDGGASGRQANAHGALSVIAATPPGKSAVAAAALGFVLLGVERLAVAVRDRRAGRSQRLRTVAQGVFYLALTWVPLSFVLGNSQAGSEQSQHQETASLLSWPAGREIGIGIGVLVVVMCGFQIRQAVTQDFEDGLDLRRAPRWMRWFAEAAGTIGITARGVIFLPIGVFLIVAAVQADPQHAKGLDAELALLARQSWWGPALLGLVATGLVVVACYSAVEARYRRVDRSG